MSNKQKLIDQHIAYCNANNFVLDQQDLNRLYAVPYKFLKTVIAQQQSSIANLQDTQAELREELNGL